MLHCRAFAITDVGSIRRENQDVVMVACAGDRALAPEDAPVSLSGEAILCGVADGMGGMPDGDVASSLVGQAFAQCAQEGSVGEGGLARRLQRLFSLAHRSIVEANSGRSAHLRMGSTLTVAFLDSRRAWIGNVGDSRCYLLRGGELRCLTTDQSVANLLLRLGHLTREEAEVHPERKVLAQALGHGTRLDIDQIELELRAGDLLLLCSDGLSDLVSDPEVLGAWARAAGDLPSCGRELVALAKQHGGFDNISVVLLAIDALGSLEGSSSAVG
ncbi:MAG: serine/threonine-protein phosphatase [Planctomycetes bacterium]|nr:serine/threonine-protein phosphatase [Planctomycetota bacterium]